MGRAGITAPADTDAMIAPFAVIVLAIAMFVGLGITMIQVTPEPHRTAIRRRFIGMLSVIGIVVFLCITLLVSINQ